MVHPIRSNAASACFAFVDGQPCDGFSGGNEGDVHRARDGLTMLQSIGDQPQGQRLHRNRRLLSGSPVGGYAGQSWNVGQPAAILLAVIFDGQREARWRLWYESMMPPIR